MNLVLTAIHIENSPRAVPLGPGILASVLKKHFPDEVQTDIQDLYLNQTPSECSEMILKFSPSIVGFSMYVWNREMTLEIASLLKSKRPDVIILVGGPEATADSDAIQSNDSIDLILPGEGEELIVQAVGRLLQKDDPSHIAKTISPAPLKDLADSPSPYLDKTLSPENYTGLLWELSRGCPFMCDFCYESRGSEGIRRFPIDRIKAELQIFQESKVEQVFVLDPTFNYNEKKAKEILQLIIDTGVETHFFFEVRSEFLDADMVDLFASIYCSLQIGMQSASNDILKKINRDIDTEDFESKVLMLHQASVAYGFDLIYGLPGDTLEGFCASLDFAMSLAPNHVDIFPLAVLPDTRLHENAEGFGLVYQHESPYLVISTPEFSEKDMQIASELAAAFDIFYNRGKAVPWFPVIIGAIDVTPSEFFASFSIYIKDNQHKDVETLQKAFVEHLYSTQGQSALSSIASDLISYFGYLSSDSTQEATMLFNHNPLDLVDQLSSGVTDLNDLAALLPEKQCTAVITPEEGEITIRIVE